MNILGICGKAGAGKDTLADLLVANHGYVKRSFADPLYEEAAAAFGVKSSRLRDRAAKETPNAMFAINLCADQGFYDCMFALRESTTKPRSPRQILQWWGTEYRRAQNVNYWLERMALFIKSAAEVGAAGVAIPDVRFANEAAWVREAGGSIIQIYRPGIKAVMAHASESGIPLEFVRQQVVNDGPISRLNDVALFASRWSSTHTEKEMAP